MLAPLLVLNIWSTPWAPSIHVELQSGGALTLASRMNDKSEKKSAQLKRQDVQLAMELAHRAVSDNDFVRGCDKMADGTNAEIILGDGPKPLQRTCVGAGQWPWRDSNTAKLLELLGKKLNRSIR